MIGQVCAKGVRAARCKFFLVSSLLETKACRKVFFDTLTPTLPEGEWGNVFGREAYISKGSRPRTG